MKNIKKPEVFKWNNEFLSMRPQTIQELPHNHNNFAITIDQVVDVEQDEENQEYNWLQCKIKLLPKEKIAMVKKIRKLDYEDVCMNNQNFLTLADGKSDCRVAYEDDAENIYFLSLKKLSYQPFNHSFKHFEREVSSKSVVNGIQTHIKERQRVMTGMDSMRSIELLPGFERGPSEGRFFLYRSTDRQIYLCNIDNFEIISLLMALSQKFIILKAKKPTYKLKYPGKPAHPNIIKTYSTRLRTKAEEERNKQIEEDKEEDQMEISDQGQDQCQKLLQSVLDHWSKDVIDNYDIVCPFNYCNIKRFRFMLPQPNFTDQKSLI
ncbi:hypothetical protein FGO68_gene17625 [Halteria grandinella]|uniref:Uncharacterized protein n=1 Tax=Halteria grandinella TaxID=5974 RepID=A0A8J8NRY9_HALGN|nr:hypothetical protein FGO68_gene17625 [Halteria grandinella]